MTRKELKKSTTSSKSKIVDGGKSPEPVMGDTSHVVLPLVNIAKKSRERKERIINSDFKSNDVNTAQVLPVNSQGDSSAGGTAIRINMMLFYTKNEWKKKRESVLKGKWAKDS